MNLDPAKLLVILMIALIVLGPERLPRVARQLGALWAELTATRTRIVSDIKGQIPDIPRVPEVPSIRKLLFESDSPRRAQDGDISGADSPRSMDLPDEVAASWEPQDQGGSRPFAGYPPRSHDPSMN